MKTGIILENLKYHLMAYEQAGKTNQIAMIPRIHQSWISAIEVMVTVHVIDELLLP